MKIEHRIPYRCEAGAPAYLCVADTLRRAIRDGRLAEGECIPSSRVLAEQWGLHRLTVMRGVELLVAEGYLVAEERRAVRVSEALPESLLTSRAAGGGPRVVRAPHVWSLVRRLPELPHLGTHPAGPGPSFHSGLPDLREFPIKEFHSFLRNSIQRQAPQKLTYSSPEGFGPFLQETKSYLAKVRSIQNKRILVTHGAQEAIFLVAQLLLGPGDGVAVEELGYQPAWHALAASGATLVPIPLRSGILCLESLERACAERKVRLIYVTPLHQYPTTVTLSVPHRARLYEIAARYGVPLLEDDYDHEFHFDSQPFAPLAADDPAGLVLYCSTLSKVLYPSARLGFLAVPDAVAAPLTNLKRVMSRQNDSWLQDGVAAWMREGGFARHLRRMRRLYQERRDVLHRVLLDAQESGLQLDWQLPSGGMSLWLDTHVNSDLLRDRLAARGVHVMPESRYRQDHAAGHHVRLGFACLNERELRLGGRMLVEEIRRLQNSGAW